MSEGTLNPAARESSMTVTQQATGDGNMVRRSHRANCAADDPLWQRLVQFEIDLKNVGLTFTERAAKENGWSLSYTRRVIDEYKRFLYLALRSGHVACPSEDVDQIWHMHLTYTRSYWDELCAKVLQQPLHHGPTEGGSEEREKYFQLYQRTQSSYEEWFGQAPPADIWPSAEKRFGEDLHFVRVNSQRHWIIPRLTWRTAAYGASGAVMLPIAQLSLNPLDWRGPVFLALFFGLVFVASLVSWLVSRWVRDSGQRYEFQPTREDEIGPIEAAWLKGGDHHALTCALVGLAQNDAVKLSGSLVGAGSQIESADRSHRVNELILQSVSRAPEGQSWRSIARDASVGLVAMRQSLEERGLAASKSQIALATSFMIAIFGSLLLLGAGKIWTGLERGRPIGILVVGEIVAFVVMFVVIKSIPRLTLEGKRLIARLKKEVQAEPRTLVGEQDAATAGDPALLWGAALLGTGILATTPLAEFDGFARAQASAATGASSSGCGAGGCGGDGGGGGGCGGGCGGCGGCGG